MKILFLPVVVLVASCSRAPECSFSGKFNQEANAGCLVIHGDKALYVEENNGKLSFPGGGLQSGEAPQCTAEREVWEETGIKVRAQRKLITFDNGFQLFECDIAGENALDGSERPWRFEINAVHWFDKHELAGNKPWRFPEQVKLVQQWLAEAAARPEEHQ